MVEVPTGPPVLATLLAELSGPDFATRRAVLAAIKKSSPPFRLDSVESFVCLKGTWSRMRRAKSINTRPPGTCHGCQNQAEAASRRRNQPCLSRSPRPLMRSKRAGLLITVERPINKDTEMHPLVRWQFRGGIEERERKAFLFTNVVDSKGAQVRHPGGGGRARGEPRDLPHGHGLPARSDRRDLEPRHRQPDAPSVLEGSALPGDRFHGQGARKAGQRPRRPSDPDLHAGLGHRAVHHAVAVHHARSRQRRAEHGHLSRPGEGAAAPGHESVARAASRHLHALGKDGEAAPEAAGAVVLGAPPCIAFASAQKVPETLDELHVAGALVGMPINVVKAKTVDLLVPAEAEIVVEGLIDTEYLEPEAPFGESHGHVNLQEYNAIMDVTAITRRRDAILTSIISQVTPSESSLIKRVALEPLFTDFLRNTLAIGGVKRVSMHEPLTNLRKVVAVVVERNTPPRRSGARSTARPWNRAAGKYVIAINDDIDPDNADAILWAMSYRANPALDLQIVPHRDQGHGPRSRRNNGEDASVLIDATIKEDFPPISLPKREYMERAKAIWEELGLPERSSPRRRGSAPAWANGPTSSTRRRSSRSRGDYFKTGEALVQRRRSDLPMNTEVRNSIARREGKGPRKGADHAHDVVASISALLRP